MEDVNDIKEIKYKPVKLQQVGFKNIDLKDDEIGNTLEIDELNDETIAEMIKHLKEIMEKQNEHNRHYKKPSEQTRQRTRKV